MVTCSGSPVLMIAAFAIACAVCLPADSTAQSLTVLSNGADARNCSVYADQASKNLFLSSDAVDTCSRALDYGTLGHNDRAATLVNRGIVQVAVKRYQNALEDYTEAMQLNPALPEAYVSRGNLWFLAESFDKAIADYDKALSLGLGRAHIAHYNRGMARERTGDRDAAIADYQQALKLQPAWMLPQEKLSKLSEPPLPATSTVPSTTPSIPPTPQP